jgi:hypothetical protein
VRYSDVAPRVDLEFYGAADGFEYDLVVRRGGDPQALTLRLDGVSSARVDEDGSIVIETSAGTFRQHRPIAFQERGGVRTPVDVRYTLRDGRIGFAAARYDRSRTLVIDPTIDFSTYLGGSGADTARAVASDAAGNIYVTGSTASIDFPTVSPAYTSSGTTDAFVAKFAPNGQTLVYATYLGGVTNEDAAYGIAVTAGGTAYVGGTTKSSDFPAVAAALGANPGGESGFVSRLSADGSTLIFSTYLGGSGKDLVEGLAIDGAGNAYVTGVTYSTDFPLQNAMRSTPGGSFITKLAAGGTVLYSTYFGDAATDGNFPLTEFRVHLHAIAVEASGAAYVGGETRGGGIQATPGAYLTTRGDGNCNLLGRDSPPLACLDGVVAKLTPAGTLAYSTYLHGPTGAARTAAGPEDMVTGIAVDGGGNAYALGTTNDGSFPTTTGANRAVGNGKVFVIKLNPAGSGLVYSARLGSAIAFDQDTATPVVGLQTGFGAYGEPSPAVAIDALGQALVTGWTRANDLPVIGAQQSKMASQGVVRVSGASTATTTQVSLPPGAAYGTFGLQDIMFGAADGTWYVQTSSGFYRSPNNGSTWTLLPVPSFGFSAPDLTIDPNNSATLYTPNATSTDRGQTWTSLGKQLERAPAIRPGSPNVLFGVAASGPVWKSVDGGLTWNPSSNGIDVQFAGGKVYISPADPNVMYFHNGTLYGSTDGGATWTPRPAAAGRIALNPTQPLTLYRAASSTGVWKSTDGAFTWTQTSSPPVSGIAAVTGSIVYASKSLLLDVAPLYRSIDGGATWTLVPNVVANALGVDAAGGGAVFALGRPLPDGFVAALSSAGALVYESYLGATQSDIPYGLATTPDGGIVVVGSTNSPDFPTVNALQPATAGSGDAFVTKLRFPQTLFSVDTPADGATAYMPFTLGGWAIDRGSASDSGIDAVHVWAISSTGAATFIGAATTTLARPDVAAVYGAQFANAGYQVMVSGLTPGAYTFVIAPHSSVTSTFAPPRILTLTVAEGGLISLDVPTDGATAYGGTKLGGWAIDRAATTDTGVSAVHVYAYPNPGSGEAPIFLGVAEYGIARPDVGASFGTQFTNSGFRLYLPPLAPGPYLLVAAPFSSVTNTFVAQVTVTVTIGPSRPNGALDQPATGATVSGSFMVAGWAIDQSAPEGTGVDALHVYAFPTSSGGAPTFLGAATLGVSRPDIGAIFGSQFTRSGYALNAPALPPDTYDVYAFSRSTVSGTFNFARVARITVP